MWYVYKIPQDGSAGEQVGDPYMSHRLAARDAAVREAQSIDGYQYVVRSSSRIEEERKK